MKSPKCFGVGLVLGILGTYFFMSRATNGGLPSNGNGAQPGTSYGNGQSATSNTSDQKTRIGDRRYFEVARRSRMNGYQNFNITA